MLYDNAQLARVYLHAYQVMGNEFYKRITTEILDYVTREMTDRNGDFIRRRMQTRRDTRGNSLCGRPRKFGVCWEGAVRACWWFLNP